MTAIKKSSEQFGSKRNNSTGSCKIQMQTKQRYTVDRVGQRSRSQIHKLDQASECLLILNPLPEYLKIHPNRPTHRTTSASHDWPRTAHFTLVLREADQPTGTPATIVILVRTEASLGGHYSSETSLLLMPHLVLSKEDLARASFATCFVSP